MVRDKRYEEALPLVEERLAVNSRDLPFLLLKAYMALDRDRFAVAEETATLALSLDPWSIDAFVVLGLAAKRTGNTDTAVAMFRRAVYACPAGWPSYYYLADTYRAKGEIEQARRSYRTTSISCPGALRKRGCGSCPWDFRRARPVNFVSIAWRTSIRAYESNAGLWPSTRRSS